MIPKFWWWGGGGFIPREWWILTSSQCRRRHHKLYSHVTSPCLRFLKGLMDFNYKIQHVARHADVQIRWNMCGVKGLGRWHWLWKSIGLKGAATTRGCMEGAMLGPCCWDVPKAQVGLSSTCQPHVALSQSYPIHVGSSPFNFKLACFLCKLCWLIFGQCI